MEYVLACAALLVGSVLGYLLAERRARGGVLDVRAAAAAAEQRCASLASQFDAQSTETADLRAQLSAAEKDAAALAAQLDAARQNLLEQRQLLDDANQQLKQAFATVSAEALAKNNEAFLQ